MTVFYRRFLPILAFFTSTVSFSAFAQTTTSERIVSPVSSGLPGRTVWAFATTGTGTNITTFAATDKGLYRSSGTTWVETTLRNQAVYAIKSRRVGNNATLLAGTNRGLMRSLDNGATWTSPEVTTGTVSTSNILSLKKVFDIEIAGNFWFAATEKGVFRSNNDGRSWTLLNIDRTVDNNEVRGITAEGNTIIVNLWREGLWRSTNNGNTWSKLTIPGETALCRAVHVQQGTNATVWLAGSVAGNIWRSVNNGTSWTRVYQTVSTARNVSPSNLTQAGIDALVGSGKTVFASTPSGIAYSLSFGQTWRHTRTTTPQAVSLAMLANQVFVGLEQNSSLIAEKGSASLQSGNDAAGQYTGSCPGDIQLGSDGCAAGGGGGGGSSGGGSIIPPSPVISSITPNPAQQINAPLSITITGTNLFGSQIRLSSVGTPSEWQLLQATSITATQIVATVPASIANVPGAYQIQLVVSNEINPSPETPVSGQFPWNVAAPQVPLPVLNSVQTSPSPLQVQQAGTLRLDGGDFAVNAQVWLRGFDGSPTQLQRTPPGSSTVLNAILPPLSASGNYRVYVVNPGNSTASQERTFTVSNPQASITGVSTSPSPVVAGQSCTVTVSGTGFVNGVSVISLSGPGGTVSVSPTVSVSVITFPFTPSAGGSYTVSVQNPGTNLVSGQFTVQTPAPAPMVSSLTQNGQPLTSLLLQSGAQTLTLNGSAFDAQTTFVRLTDGATVTDITPTSRSASALTFTLPASALQTALKTLTLSAVTLPFPGTSIGGGTSSGLPLHVILPQPALTSISQETSLAGAAAFPLTLQGMNIFPGQTFVQWVAGRDTLRLTVQPNNSASIPASALLYPTLATVHLVNPTYQTLGGGISTVSKNFTVQNTTPRLDSINPRSYAWFGVETQIPMLIHGDFSPSTVFRFQSGSTTAELRPTPQNFSSSRVQIDVPFALIGLTPPGTATVRAVNLALSQGGQDLLSARTDTFRIVNPAPRIFTAAPEFTMTTVPQSITLSGEMFLTGVSASIGGVNALVQRNSANQIVVSFDAAVQARLQSLGAGVHHLIVRNPAPALADASLSITLVHPAITTLTVSPNPHTLTAPPSAQIVTLTALQANGTPYIATNATVSFRGQTFPILSRPAQDRITATIPASLLAEAGNFPITVNQPAVQNASGQSVGASSQSASWVLNNPRPVVSGMTTNPAPVLAGSDVVLTIDGSAFVPLAKVVVRRTAQSEVEYTPSANSGTRITVTIPALALDSLGTFPVIVRNPQGGGDALNQPLLTVLAPRPRLLLMSPQTSVLSLSNQQPISLSFGGSGFVRGSRLVWNLGSTTSVLPTTYANNAQVSAIIPANLLTQAGIFRVAIVNDSFNGQGGIPQGGGTSDTLTFTLNNPQAILQSASPQLLPRFAASAALALTGDNFVQGARLLVSTIGAPGLNNVTDTLTAQVLSPTSIQTTLPASLLDSAATLQIRVLNPAPVQAPSGAVQVAVVNPRPRLVSLSPTQTLTGAASLTVNASGNTFMDGLTAFASGSFGTVPVQTERTNDNAAVLTLPANVLAQAGTVSIALQNPAPRVQPEFSDTLSITVNNPLPRLDSAVAGGQTSLMVSTVATTVSLFGDNFILASSVKENGSSISGGRSESTLSSSRLSLTQITTTIPASMTAEAGVVRLTVENPLPGGGRSQSVVMNVLHPVPTLERITPSVVTIPTNDLSITLTGDRFVNAADVLVNGQAVTVTQRSATRLTATIPAAMLKARGFYEITVRNPMTNAPTSNDGGTSGTLLLRVNTPQPLLTSLSPAQIPLDTLDVAITITGSRFLNEATVRITTPDGTQSSIATTNITATEIRALLPQNLINRGGIYSLRVENPAPTDAISQALTFALVNPVPQMDSISPSVIVPQLSTQNSTFITVRGQKFTPTSIVRWRGQDLATTFVSRTTLTAVIPPSQQTRGAVGAVTVFTPTDGVVVAGNPVGGGTGSAPGTAGVLTLTHGMPTLTASVPANVLRDAWNVSALPTITLNGQLLASTATVRIQSAAGMTTVDTVLTPNSVSANGQNLTLTLPRAVVVTAGTFSLTVINPRAFAAQMFAGDGGTSAALSLTVQNPTPALVSLNPASLAAASPTTSLTVNGSNFTRETQLFVNGSPAPRTVMSASQLTTSLPAELFTLSGFVRVQVLNPAPSQTSNPSGDSSNTLQLEIFNPVPVLTSVNPVFAPIGGRTPADSVTLTLVGSNFVRNSQARIATTVAGAPTTDLPTTFVATTTLTVRVLAADYRAGAYNITVLNPAPRGGTSVARRFTVTNPLPILTALLPNSTTASGKAWTLAVVGNFFTATSQISYNGVLQSLANTRFAPMTNVPMANDTLFVKLPAVPVGDTTFPVVVVNPPTGGVGGGSSDTLRLAIGLPAPTITTLSPATTTATLGDQNRAWTLTVNGTLFDNAAQVFVNGQPVFTEFVSTTRLRAVLPDSLQAKQARRNVQVRNTPVLTSNVVTHTVQNPAPVLTAIDPTSIIAGRDTAIVLSGDRFAPDATVRFTFGTTTTVLLPSRRDSVIGLTVNLPAALIPSRGSYSLRVSNPALSVDTLLLGGGLSATQTLTVNADKPHSVEYIGLDTLINTGDRLWFFTLRFRDKTGNLVDNDPVTLNYVNTDSTVITGSFPLTRTSLGNYRADTLRFPTAGRYLVQVDTTYSGKLSILGQDRFTVLTRGASRVEIEGVTSTFTAGDSLPRLTFRYFDNQNNPTDLGTRTVVVTATIGGAAYRDTLVLTRRETGVYEAPQQQYTGAALYTITPLAITAAAVTAVTGERTFTVTPRPAAQVAFSGVTPLLTTGGAQARFRATLRDTYNNLTDEVRLDSLTVVQPTQVAFSLSTDATLDDSTKSANAGFFTLQRTSLGVFTADAAAPFLQAGAYTLSIQGVASTTGTAAFTVRPNVDFRVVFEGVPDTLVAGDSLRNVVVRYFDRNNNPTDNGLGRVVYSRSGGSSTATVQASRLETGVYALASTQATIAGNYSLAVSGITSLNMEGKRTFVVRPAAPTLVEMVISTSAMTSRGSNVTFSLTYTDSFNNLTDWNSTLTIRNVELASTATVELVRQSVGRFRKIITVLEPGGYDVEIDSVPSGGLDIIGANNFACSPGRPVRVRFSNVPSTLTAGEALTGAFMTFFDVRGRTTNNNWQILMLGSRGAEIIEPINFSPRDTIITQHSGIFDIDPTAFTTVGVNTLVIQSDVDYQLPTTGNNQFTVRPGQAVAATISFGALNADSSANAASALPITIRFHDALGNPTDVATPVQLMASTSAFVPTFANSSLVRVLTRSVVGGVPQFTTTVTPSTAGTYTFALGALPTISSVPRLVGRNPLVVIPAVPRTVEIALSAPSVLMNSGELCVTLTFRDAAGNLADIQSNAPGVGSSLSFQYTSGAISSMGTITVNASQRQSLGVYQVCGLRFAQANINPTHTYALFVAGITVANTRGQRTFQVLNPLPALFSITPSVIIESCGSTVGFMNIDRGSAGLSAANATNTTNNAAPNSAPVPTPERLLPAEKPALLKLYPNAPNPFREATTLWYDLADDADVSLTVKNIAGTMIAEVLHLHQKAGSYEAQWTPPASLPSGTYFLHLVVKTGNGKQMMKTISVQRLK